MDDGVHALPLEQRRDERTVADVALYERGPPPLRRHGRAVPGAQVVEHHDT